MSMIKIKGKVTYKNISTGFWGIIDSKGKKWRPIEMPQALKKEGMKVVVKAMKVEDNFSIFMWGTPVTILSIE